MAEKPDDDVLELEVEALEGDEAGKQGEAQEGDEDGDDEEVVVGFGEDEAAPASEGETSTIREMRAELRKAQRENAELRKKSAPPKVEAGPKPTMESVEYDEDRYDEALLSWQNRKAQAERDAEDSEEAEKKEREATLAKVEAYKADRARLKVPDFDVAEKSVYAALGDQYFGLLMESDKRAALVYALYRDPTKLDELAKLTPLKAAMLVGKLEDKVTVSNRRKPPQPDQPLRGNTNVSAAGSDRELARLEKEADQTGDRTALIAFRKKLKAN